MSIFRILSAKIDQKSIVGWITATILIIFQCVISTMETLQVVPKQGMSFAQMYLLSMSLWLNLIFVYSIFLIFLTSDAYQNKDAWSRSLLTRAGNRKNWLAAHILYLSIFSGYIVFVSIISCYFSCILFLDPKFLMSNQWDNLALMKNTFPDVFVWNWSPFKSVSVFSLLLFLRFLFISMAVFCINLTQKKRQLGFVFPLLLGLMERNFDGFFPSLSSYTIMPFDHTVLSGKISLITGVMQSRVPIGISFLYWVVLIGLTVLWAFAVSSRKDFAVLEDDR